MKHVNVKVRVNPNNIFAEGDRVEFQIDGKTLYDTISYIDGNCIEGEVYDLTHVKGLKKVKK